MNLKFNFNTQMSTETEDKITDTSYDAKQKKLHPRPSLEDEEQECFPSKKKKMSSLRKSKLSSHTKCEVTFSEAVEEFPNVDQPVENKENMGED